MLRLRPAESERSGECDDDCMDGESHGNPGAETRGNHAHAAKCRRTRILAIA
jgi:hypothetical protein